MLRKLILLLLLCFGATSYINAATHKIQQQLPHSFQESADQLFAKWDRANSPGCVAAVLKNGEPIYMQGFGMANLEHGKRLHPQSVLEVASLAKQFTAACVLVLESQGKLKLNDPVRHHLDFLPEHIQPVSLQHLLHHTSGIHDFFELATLSGYSHEDYFTEGEVMELICRQQKLVFEPGTDHLYNNSGYFLLAKVVEKISGLSLREFAHIHLFEPLNMENTRFNNDPKEIILNRAQGYGLRPDGRLELSISPLAIIGDGGLLTTAEDLAKWDANFFSNKLAIPDFAHKMYKRGHLNDGTPLNYATGLDCGEYRGLTFYGHTGSFVGFRSAILRFPSLGISVICMANFNQIGAGTMAFKLADLYLDYMQESESVELPPPPVEQMHREVLISPYIFEPYTGNYEFGNGRILNISNEKGHFYAHIIGQAKFEIFPESESDFFVKETDLIFTFTRDGKSKVSGVSMRLSGRQIYAQKTMIKPVFTYEQLQEYTGTYFNEELNVTYRLEADRDRLYYRVGNKGKENTDFLKKDRLILSDGTAAFLRDTEGQVVAFEFSSGQVAQLTFRKLSQ